MLKKTMTRLTLAGALALGAIGIANASDSSGFYLGGQIGWADTHTGLSTMVGSETANQIASELNSSLSNAVPYTASKDTGIAGRAFFGYQFSPYYAGEFGFAKFHDARVSGGVSGIDTDNHNANTNLSYSGVSKVHAFDLLGKGIMPLGDDFSLFAKLGAAYVQQTSKLSFSETINSTPVTGLPALTKHNNRFMPVAGVGISYDATPNLPVDVSWLHYQKVGGNIPNIDLVSLGLAYKIND